jgi:hypothetical protein
MRADLLRDDAHVRSGLSATRRSREIPDAEHAWAAHQRTTISRTHRE